MTRQTGARLRNWVLQRGCAAHGRRALHMYDMGRDTIRTRQHGWMAGNETRADTSRSLPGEEKSVKTRRPSNPEQTWRCWVHRTAIAISQAHPGTHEFERPR